MAYTYHSGNKRIDGQDSNRRQRSQQTALPPRSAAPEQRWREGKKGERPRRTSGSVWPALDPAASAIDMRRQSQATPISCGRWPSAHWLAGLLVSPRRWVWPSCDRTASRCVWAAMSWGCWWKGHAVRGFSVSCLYCGLLHHLSLPFACYRLDCAFSQELRRTWTSWTLKSHARLIRWNP